MVEYEDIVNALAVDRRSSYVAPKPMTEDQVLIHLNSDDQQADEEEKDEQKAEDTTVPTAAEAGAAEPTDEVASIASTHNLVKNLLRATFFTPQSMPTTAVNAPAATT